MQSAKSGLEPFWELTCCKRCARLWFKARFDIIMLKAAGWRRFWKLGCWKSARRCYAKYVSKSKGTFGPLLDAPMSKKCTALLHQAYFKSTTFGSLLDAQMLFFVACVRDSAPLQNGWGCKDSQRHISHDKRHTRYTIGHVWRSGCWFPWEGCST